MSLIVSCDKSNETPPTWKACIRLLEFLFSSTISIPEFQRQLALPNVPKFSSALLRLAEKSEDRQIRVLIPQLFYLCSNFNLECVSVFLWWASRVLSRSIRLSIGNFTPLYSIFLSASSLVLPHLRRHKILYQMLAICTLSSTSRVVKWARHFYGARAWTQPLPMHGLLLQNFGLPFFSVCYYIDCDVLTA